MIKAYIDGIKNWRIWYGRTRRRDYWLYVLCNLLVVFILYTLATVFTLLGFKTLSILTFVATYAYAVLQIIPTIAIDIRRLHDTGRSGGFYFIQLIPYVGGVWFFVLTLLPGTKGGNYFGPDPRDTFVPQDSTATYSEYADFSGKE